MAGFHLYERQEKAQLSGRQICGRQEKAPTSKGAQKILENPYYDCGAVFMTEHICVTHPAVRLKEVNFMLCKLNLKKSDYFKVDFKGN